MSFYTFVLYDKHFRLALSTCGEHKWTNNAYIAKLHFISKYDNRSVETIHHKARGAGPGPPISLWNIWKVIKWHVHDEYMILKITKVICKHASLSIYTAPELSNADTGVPIVTLDENLSNNYPCPHLCTWMHNNVQNNCNHCAVKFGCTKKVIIQLHSLCHCFALK